MMTPVDQTLRRKLLNHRIEQKSDKLLIAIYISKIGNLETIELVYNFDKILLKGHFLKIF